MECCSYDTKRFFLFWMRMFFGIWLLYAGVMKLFFMGPEAFIGYITSQFDATWSPHALNVALAWVILIAEPVLAIMILSGKKQRSAWMLTTMLMFLLLMGQSMLMKPEVINNWIYLVLTLVCASMADPSTSCCSKKSE